MMMQLIHIPSAVLLLICSAAIPCVRAELRAGVARVEITPSFLGPMYGYANRRCGPANGTHDPLFAKALVLSSGDTRLAIVTLDLGSLVSERLTREIPEKLKIPIVLLAASHSHSAPMFLPPASPAPSAPSPPAPYLTELEDKIFDAVRRASEAMFPARIGVGRGSMRLGYNRLLLRDDGRSRALFDNLERIPYGPVDPEFMLLRVEDSSGATRALLVHYATHAVVLGPANCKYSADYPGVMQAKIEAEMPGAQCMFVQGGAGDINPLFMARTGKEEEDFSTTRKMGELLAAEVLKARARIQPVDIGSEPIRHTSELLKFRDRWEKDRTLDVGISTVLIGRHIAIAATPGELMHKLQTRWKQDADVPHAFFYGYTYSAGGIWPGYIPDLRTAAYGGYGGDASTRIEVGAGETIMQRHLIHLFGMRGMWKNQPGRP
ncbi:MAG: neutral/alkaline non-lysosomal ceramidase N-terminal domain-containing protein [Bryobacteraceae bacterium]